MWSAAMLAAKRSAHVTPEVNLRNSLHACESMQARDPPWLWNPGETSPEVQNRGISGQTKRTHVLQKLLYKKKYCCDRIHNAQLRLSTHGHGFVWKPNLAWTKLANRLSRIEVSYMVTCLPWLLLLHTWLSAYNKFYYAVGGPCITTFTVHFVVQCGICIWQVRGVCTCQLLIFDLCFNINIMNLSHCDTALYYHVTLTTMVSNKPFLLCHQISVQLQFTGNFVS